MKYWRFLCFELLAALLWNTLYCLLGYWVAVEFNQLLLIFERSGLLIGGIFLLLLAVYWFWKRQHRHTKRNNRLRYRVTRG